MDREIGTLDVHPGCPGPALGDLAPFLNRQVELDSGGGV